MKRLFDYIRSQGVMAIAVGFIVATITLTVVSAIVFDLISPLIGAIIQTSKLDSLTFTIKHSTFSYGHLLTVGLYLAALLPVLYLFINKILPGQSDLQGTAAQVVPAPQASSPACPSCGAPLLKGARFCRECGTPTDSTPAAQAPKCPGCGAQLDNTNAAFCGECGARI